MEKPIFILYYGTLNEIQTLYPIMESIGTAWEKDRSSPVNVVVCAMGFSESVLATLAANFPNHETLNIFPLTIPKNAVHNSELFFLQDVQALTSATIFDPLTNPISKGTLEDCGQPLDYFECSRYRSNIVGLSDESLLMARIEELKVQLEAPESIYEKLMLEDRVAKLTGGIAKLTVYGPSAGEIREKRDRAEDAVCAIRGAIKHGALPGGCWTLVHLCQVLTVECDRNESLTKDEIDVIESVLIEGLREPMNRLMTNAGLNEDEVLERYTKIIKSTYSAQGNVRAAEVWNGITDTFVNAVETGIVDSVPAVLEAIRNSISIATLLGTLGGCVVFQRDDDVERNDSADAYHYLANSIQKDR
jgi:chaperonin GroEL